MQQESFSPVAYYDTNGFAIGYGNHYWQDGSAVTSDDTITQTDAVQLLTDTLTAVYNTIAPCIRVALSDQQVGALLDLGYNWGASNVCSSQLLALINAGAPIAQIDAQWRQTAITAGGVYNGDLYSRRAAEDLMYDGSGSAIAAGIPIAAVLVGVGIIWYLSTSGE